MQNDGSTGDSIIAVGFDNHSGNSAQSELHQEKQAITTHVFPHDAAGVVLSGDSELKANPTLLAIVISNSELPVTHVVSTKEDLPTVASSEKGYLSRNASAHEQCRVCQQEKEEVLIDLGCKCRGGLAKAHRSCIDTWFNTRGSNICEICQETAVNVSPPQSQPSTNYWIWRIDPALRPRDRERGCFSPLWVAFSILIGGLLLDVLISITLGVSALPVNIIIGIIVVLGLGTAIRLALEFCYERNFRRVVVQRADGNLNRGYHPAL